MSDNKYCYNCRHYKPYYTKGYIKFDKRDLGYCVHIRGTVEKHNICPKFDRKHYAPIGLKHAALKTLIEHVEMLAEIKQILEEDNEDSLEELLVSLKAKRKNGD